MSAADLYPRPSREEIAARVKATEPTVIPVPAGDAAPEPESARALANFAVHLNARMRALGWDAAALADKSGFSTHVTGRAVNGTAVDLGTAEKLAALVGGYLAAMIGPYMCSTCAGEPPAGFACLECGTEARAS